MATIDAFRAGEPAARGRGGLVERERHGGRDLSTRTDPAGGQYGNRGNRFDDLGASTHSQRRGTRACATTLSSAVPR